MERPIKAEQADHFADTSKKVEQKERKDDKSSKSTSVGAK